MKQTRLVVKRELHYGFKQGMSLGEIATRLETTEEVLVEFMSELSEAELYFVNRYKK